MYTAVIAVRPASPCIDPESLVSRRALQNSQTHSRPSFPSLFKYSSVTDALGDDAKKVCVCAERARRDSAGDWQHAGKSEWRFVYYNVRSVLLLQVLLVPNILSKSTNSTKSTSSTTVRVQHTSQHKQHSGYSSVRLVRLASPSINPETWVLER